MLLVFSIVAAVFVIALLVLVVAAADRPRS